MNFWASFWGGRSLRSALDTRKKVKIRGVRFVIRKLNALDFMTGAKVLQQTFQTYEEKRKAKANSLQDFEVIQKKLKEHYRDVFLASVIEPKLSRKDTGEEVCVDEILADSEMCDALYLAIMDHTYGKKKVFSALEVNSQ